MGLSNVRIGAMRVIYKGVDLGNTLGGVEIKLDRKFVDLNVDKHGETPVDKSLQGQSLTVKVMLAEPTNANFNVAVPEGDDDNYALGERVGFGTQSGYLLGQDAGLLQLRPLKNVATNVDTEDVNVYKAVSAEPIVQKYTVKDQRVLEITFEALVDESYGDGRTLAHIGSLAVS